MEEGPSFNAPAMEEETMEEKIADDEKSSPRETVKGFGLGLR